MQPKRSKPTNAESLDAAWADLARRAAPKVPPHGSITIYEFGKMANQSEDTARRFLEGEVKAGRMTSDLYMALNTGQKRLTRYFTPVP